MNRETIFIAAVLGTAVLLIGAAVWAFSTGFIGLRVVFQPEAAAQ